MTMVETKDPVLTADHPAGAAARPVCRQRRFEHWADEIYYEGAWEVGPLRDALTGHISKGGDQSACAFTIEACGLILQFWSHPWSGVARIEIDGRERQVDLFGEAPGMKNVHFDGLTPGVHLVRAAAGKRPGDPPSGEQIVFHAAVVYDRLTEVAPKPVGHTSSGNKPARFNAIYHAPGPLGWAERAVLYSTVFGAGPRNVLLVGKGQTGAAQIVVAALDDRDAGALTYVDPDPNIAPDLWQKMGHRTALVVGGGPEALAEGRTRAGADFDLAVIDHADTLSPDWPAIAPVLSNAALILVHAAPQDFALAHPDLRDDDVLVPKGESTGGLRLLRRRAKG
jgi:predicted O-methyltransferase YrrM